MIFDRHNFGSGPFGGDIETLLYSIGGYWRGFGSVSDVNSWIDSPYCKQRKAPRQVSYNMFSVVNELTDCLEVPAVSNQERSPIIGECVQPNSSSKSIENGTPSLEVSETMKLRRLCMFSSVMPNFSSVPNSSPKTIENGVISLEVSETIELRHICMFFE